MIGSVNIYDSDDPWPEAYAGGGKIGVTFQSESFAPPDNDAGFDDFGGGTLTGELEDHVLFMPFIANNP